MRYFRFWVCFGTILLFDICTKNWVVENAFELRHNPIVVLEGQSDQKSFLEFTYVTNPGAAWSMLSDYPMVLTVLAALALCAIYAFRSQLEIYRIVNQFIFGTICGGIAGNLSDRIFREPAEVVDFIDVFIPIINYDYPIFNIADSGIFLGAFGYIIVGFYDSKKLKQTEQKNT